MGYSLVVSGAFDWQVQGPEFNQVSKAKKKPEMAARTAGSERELTLGPGEQTLWRRDTTFPLISRVT